jgi:hypothetical protein
MPAEYKWHDFEQQVSLSNSGGHDMTKMFTAVIIAAGFVFGAQNVQAHCDSPGGPVAKAAQKALEIAEGARPRP